MLRIIVLLLSLLFSLSAQASTDTLINWDNPALTLLEFFGLGLLLAFTPCVLPMIPILSGIIVGEKKISPMKAFQLSFTFVISMAFTYAIAGVIAGYLGHTVQDALQSTGVIVAFSSLFVIMALSMFGLYDLRIPSFLQNKIHQASNAQTRGSLIGVAMMGVLSTLIASPCVTAPLVSVLTYISQTGSPFIGGSILFVLALGMGAPLLLFGMGQGTLLPRAGGWMNQIKWIFGILMLATAIWMLSRVISSTATIGLLTALILFSFVKLSRDAYRSRHHVWQIILVFGLITSLGITYLPLTRDPGLEAAKQFTVVKSEPEFLNALNQAQNTHQPILIDFWASWCPDCASMDKTFFSDPSIQTQLQSFARIRVDVTDQKDPWVKNIRQDYKVFGTPTVIFISATGQELANRLNGSVDSNTLKKIIAQAE